GGRRKSFRQVDRVVERKLDTGTCIINKYEVLKELGRGSFGAVYQCKDTDTGLHYAMKASQEGGSHRGEQLAESLRREVAAMKKLRHPNIVTLWEVIDDPRAQKVYMIQEYMDKGPILPESYDVTPLSPADALHKFAQAVRGLHYLHTHGVIHGDIKPANLLEDSAGRVKIADFGACVVSKNDSEDGGGASATGEHGATAGEGGAGSGAAPPSPAGAAVKPRRAKGFGTPVFMAPELLRAEPAEIGPATDVWALGVTLYQMVVGKVPGAPSPTLGAVAGSASTAASGAAGAGQASPGCQELEPNLKHLVMRMLDKDPWHRATLEEVMYHDWTIGEGICP
ncbi:unnamed protein product, partial [Phaeothamnion confervicola]